MLEILEFATAEVADAAAHYGQFDTGLASRFLKSVQLAYEQIVETPEFWPIWSHPGTELGIRRVRVKPFPHFVVYITAPRLVVVALMHPKRHPGHLVSRLGGLQTP